MILILFHYLFFYAHAVLPPSSRIEKTAGSANHFDSRLQPEDDEAFDIRLTTIRSIRGTTAAPFQDYPDYEMPHRQGWPPPQEPIFQPNGYNERSGNRPMVRPIQSVQEPIMAPEYVPTRAPLPPLRFRQRRPNDVWVRTNGAYPEFVNLRSLGTGISDIGLPPISDPVSPMLPVDNFPAIPYPDLPGYPERQTPFEGYGTYRNRPVRVVDPQTGYGRFVEPRYANRQTGPGNMPMPAHGGYSNNNRGDYGPPQQPSYRSFPSERTNRIPSPYGYSYAGYIERQSRMYPIMIYTLESCPACHKAKRLLAINYADVASHFLELAGDEEWQRQLHIDLQNLTGAGRFPYIFVCGHFIGGAMDLHELHSRGQLRAMLQQCTRQPFNKEKNK